MFRTFAAATSAIALLVGSAHAAYGQAAAAVVPQAPKFTLETPIEQIAADPKGKAVLEANMPKLMNGPMYDRVKTMSIRQLQPMSQGRITQEMLDKIGAELSAIS